MPENRDFDSMRISLASPEQIRSWSMGEVLKPETINYRTLKPEKDGLFCEKIFGPQKDFECACGKYKRVRYKGIICDKCGVEVTRSKVRRERMGHVELAAPVSHIWYLKGTPSRIALLLDISPRKLERVVYFAQYIITHVDEAAKQRAIEFLRLDAEDAIDDQRQRLLEMQGKVEEAERNLLAEIEARLEADLEAVDSGEAERLAALNEQAVLARAEITELDGRKARRKIQIGEIELAKRGDPVDAKEMRAELETRLQAALDEAAAAAERDRGRVREQAERDIGGARENVAEQSERLRDQIDTLEQRAQDELEQRIERDLRPLADPVATGNFDAAILTEQRAEELMELYPGVVRCEMGAEAVLSLIQRMDLDALAETLKAEMGSKAGQRRKKAMKRLRVVDGLRKSTNQPAWMFFRALPVLPPDLRPMVQLDGGRFATSDLNDLYRRVINRNNRLKRLLELGAPEIILRNEKRMLQEAVDSLIDNGRRGRAVTGSGSHQLKSLSDMLKGKQGRFRQNLLGKRVDYAGRSVIVVGPNLKLHQCGLPRKMALELFKPFLMYELVRRSLAPNIKSAKRIVEQAMPEVREVLDDVVKRRPVLLNRAPTLHRLGIQAFEPVLVDGSAIQIHPLVCSAFNADFDGDQMAVHVPLSRAAVAEARQVMLSTKNLLLPSNGEPVVAPTLDMVMGCFYLTLDPPAAAEDEGGGEAGDGAENGAAGGRVFPSFDDVRLSYELRAVDLHEPIRARDAGRTGGEIVETTPGRVIFDEIVPDALPFSEINRQLDKKALKQLIVDCHRLLGAEDTAVLADRIKGMGFRFATRSGATFAFDELRAPAEKARLVRDAEDRADMIRENFEMGLLTEEERYQETVNIWTETTQTISNAIEDNLREYGSVDLMLSSGAKGNMAQVRQMAGMRGLMSDPSGRIIELPIRSSFRDGLSVLEYFISTHGARKGLADTALRTADSGYLTRRLIDVSQDVIIREHDCVPSGISVPGIRIGQIDADVGILETLEERVVGRYAASPIANPETGEVLLEANSLLDAQTVADLTGQGVRAFHVRSPMSCRTRHGLCQLCYGQSLASGGLIELGEAVGIIAAQSIGEPGTQLTMRTFHTGGIAGVSDITSGLPRVEEIFEARVPKGQAVIAEIDGEVEVLREGELRKVRVTATDVNRDEYDLPPGTRVLVKDGQTVEAGEFLARLPKPAGEDEGDAEEDPEERRVRARVDGVVERRARSRRLSISYSTMETREYEIAAAARLRVEEGQQVEAGERLTEGSINPQDMMRILGVDAVHRYLVTEVQEVYRAQGVNIHDKHIEVIVRQMLRKVRIENAGDSDWLPGELVDRHRFNEINENLGAEGKEQPDAEAVLLGVTKASLEQDSWLSAASFQETTRVLTEAAINGAVDNLVGLKENVIIGKMIPARAEIELPPPEDPPPLPLDSGLPLGGLELGAFGDEEDDLDSFGFRLDDEEDFPLSRFDEEGGYIAEPTEA